MRWRIVFILLFLGGVGTLAFFLVRERLEEKMVARALPVPDGDVEIAWFNTSTGGVAWERFVLGIHRVVRTSANLEMDDSRAFLDQSTATPEIVLSWKDGPGKLRIRWYKQTGAIGTSEWIDALAQRNPAPLAIIGGGTSDRALDLAQKLNDRTQWRGSRPLFFITTATANEVDLPGGERRSLTQIYPDRTFRFCFTNEQMAKAVIDFLWQDAELRPRGGAAAKIEDEPYPVVFPIRWDDDPYSIDLYERFHQAVQAKTEKRFISQFTSHAAYSVGSFERVNQVEDGIAQNILAELPIQPGQRSLLIMPTSTTPARRFLRALAGDSPLIGRHLVAVNGDAISINDVYRDGSLLWNIRDVPIPLVFFAHQNPIGWDEYLPPPTGTDDVLLLAEMVRVLTATIRPSGGELVRDADALLRNMRSQKIIAFDGVGNREKGSEFIVCLKPEISGDGRIGMRAPLQVWTRSARNEWSRVRPEETLLAPALSRPVRRDGPSSP